MVHFPFPTFTPVGISALEQYHAHSSNATLLRALCNAHCFVSTGMNADGSLVVDMGRMQAGRTVTRSITLRNDGAVSATVKFDMASPSQAKYGRTSYDLVVKIHPLTRHIHIHMHHTRIHCLTHYHAHPLPHLECARGALGMAARSRFPVTAAARRWCWRRGSRGTCLWVLHPHSA